MAIKVDVNQSSIEQARKLAQSLRELGDKDLIPALRREISAGTKQARVRVRTRIRAALPRRGGLNLWVGRTPTASTRILPRKASVSIRLGRKDHDLRQLNNRGIARHPLFGLRRHWFTTYLPSGAGFWQDAFEPEAPEMRQSVEVAIRSAIAAAVANYGGGE